MNAGGLNPAGLAAAMRALSADLGIAAQVAHVEGDDLISRATELGLGSPLTANAYLGAWGIAECLRAGADIVITGRVTDASLVVGAAASHFGWKRDDWKSSAGAVVAGHVLECGAQATAATFAFFTELELGTSGFPIAEIEDGSLHHHEHPGTGGADRRHGPRADRLRRSPAHATPAPTSPRARHHAGDPGRHRSRAIHDATGERPPPRLKVCLNHVGGYRNDVPSSSSVSTSSEGPPGTAADGGRASGSRRWVWNLLRTDREDADDEARASACCVSCQDPRSFGGRPCVQRCRRGARALELSASRSRRRPATGLRTASTVRPSSRLRVPHVAVLPTERASRSRLAETLELRPSARADPVPRPPPRRTWSARRWTRDGRAQPATRRHREQSACCTQRGGVSVLVHTLDNRAGCALSCRDRGLPGSAMSCRGCAMNFVSTACSGRGVVLLRARSAGQGAGEWLRARHVVHSRSLL